MKPTISDEYRAINSLLHEDPEFRISGNQNTDVYARVASTFKVQSILDYGCGKGRFKEKMNKLVPDIKIYEYDPAIPGKQHCRARADMVVCGDVLEHIEPHLLPNVLAHLKSIMEVCVLMMITHTPANRTLPDGRNAHLIQEPYPWWEKAITTHIGKPVKLVSGMLASGVEAKSLVGVSVARKYDLEQFNRRSI